MAHESKGVQPTVAELGEQAQKAHEAQHGTVTANENLKAAQAKAEADEAEAEAKAKAQAPAEDKSAKAPKA